MENKLFPKTNIVVRTVNFFFKQMLYFISWWVDACIGCRKKG